MKIFRAYVITVIACLSITALTACMFIADENAKKISLGEEHAIIVLNPTEESLDKKAINPLPFLSKLTKNVKKAASIAPPPISNIYWLIVNSEKEEN